MGAPLRALRKGALPQISPGQGVRLRGDEQRLGARQGFLGIEPTTTSPTQSRSAGPRTRARGPQRSMPGRREVERPEAQVAIGAARGVSASRRPPCTRARRHAAKSATSTSSTSTGPIRGLPKHGGSRCGELEEKISPPRPRRLPSPPPLAASPRRLPSPPPLAASPPRRLPSPAGAEPHEHRELELGEQHEQHERARVLELWPPRPPRMRVRPKHGVERGRASPSSGKIRDGRGLAAPLAARLERGAEPHAQHAQHARAHLALWPLDPPRIRGWHGLERGQGLEISEKISPGANPPRP